jgi:hypothetical protein
MNFPLSINYHDYMNKKLLTLIPVLALITVPLSAYAAISVGSTASAIVAPTSITTDIHATLPTGDMPAITPAAISSDTDLNTYSNAAITSDNAANAGVSASDNGQIKDVTYQDDGVTVDFTQPVKFLGLFPTSINATAVAKADSTVTVSYPWYSFLVRKHSAAINSIFQTQVAEATANQNTSATVSASTMSPSMKAMIFDAMRQAIHGLKSKAAVSADASASGSAGM